MFHQFPSAALLDRGVFVVSSRLEIKESPGFAQSAAGARPSLIAGTAAESDHRKLDTSRREFVFPFGSSDAGAFAAPLKESTSKSHIETYGPSAFPWPPIPVYISVLEITLFSDRSFL